MNEAEIRDLVPSVKMAVITVLILFMTAIGGAVGLLIWILA